MKSKSIRRTGSALPLAAAIAGLTFTTSSTFAGDITIDNPGFEYGNGGITPAPHNTTVIDDWVSETTTYIDNRNDYKPASDAGPCLYLSNGSAQGVHQDLNHFWSAGDTFTLGLTGQNPTWDATDNKFKVQLRQTDGTVLWDSGELDVSGTVLGGVYTGTVYTGPGTGHIFSWTIDASTFAGAGVVAGSQINIRLAAVAGSSSPTYLDDVTLSVEGVDVINPILASTIPADDADTIYPSPDLVATFSEDIALTGNGSVTIRDLGPGPDVVIDLSGSDPDGTVSASGTDLTINPTADLNLDTNYAIQISADAVEDLAANPFAGILDDTTWNFQTIAETTPPTLASTSPVDDASGVATNTNLVATFSETVEAGSGNITIKNLTEATDTVIPVGDGQVSISGTEMTIDPTSDLDPGDDYAIQIDAGAIKDTAGNLYAGILAPDITTWNFTTLADTIDPTITALSPADNASAVNNRIYLVATFSEPIVADTGDITIKNLSDVTQTVISVTDPEVSISGDTLTVDPGANLDFGDNYAIQIDAGAITDPSANPFAGIGDDVTWNFTTRPTPTVITINNAGFESSSTGIGNGNNTDIDDWTEDVGNAYVDTNGTTWVPELSDTLYISGASVNQDLGHNWSASDSFTLCLIAMNPRYSDNNNTFKVQLRQASDDTVLWDSGDQNVGGTVTTTVPSTYTGAGHLLSWTIDASAFSSGTENEQINIRIAHVSGGPVYADKVSLDVIGGGGGGNDFTDWITLYPGVGGQTGINDDPDGDGVDSGVENFFGTAPDTFSQGLVSSAADTGAGTFTFTHPQTGTIADDLTATYRWSVDLANFFADGVADGGVQVDFVATPDSPSPGTTTVVATVTGPVPAKLFVNVEVTQN